MLRKLLFTLPALLLTASLAPAQTAGQIESNIPRPEEPGDSATIVGSFYKQYLRHAPDATADVWISALRTGHTTDDVLSGILASDEYYRVAGGTRPAYVRQLYVDIIGRTPLPAEIDYWAGRLRYQTRKEVAYHMIIRHPRNVSGTRPVPPNNDPGFYPDPASPTFRDPGGPYFHSPYFYNYEKRRSIHAFPTRAQG